MSQPLYQKVCVACEGGTPPLDLDKINLFLKETPTWTVVDGVKITKNFAFKNFAEALAFTNQVGQIAETENHHPDIFIHSWNKADITLSAHALKGLSENDFIVASKIDRLN